MTGMRGPGLGLFPMASAFTLVMSFWMIGYGILFHLIRTSPLAGLVLRIGMDSQRLVVFHAQGRLLEFPHFGIEPRLVQYLKSDGGEAAAARAESGNTFGFGGLPCVRLYQRSLFPASDCRDDSTALRTVFVRATRRSFG